MHRSSFGPDAGGMQLPFELVDRRAAGVRSDRDRRPCGERCGGPLRLLVRRHDPAELAHGPLGEPGPQRDREIGATLGRLRPERREPPQDRVHEASVARVGEGDGLRHRGVGGDAQEAQLVGPQAQRRAGALGGGVDRTVEQRRERVVDRDQPAERAVGELGRERRVAFGQADPRERSREGEVGVRAFIGDAPDHVERDRTRGRRRLRPPAGPDLGRRPGPPPVHGTRHPSDSPITGR